MPQSLNDPVMTAQSWSIAIDSEWFIATVRNIHTYCTEAASAPGESFDYNTCGTIVVGVWRGEGLSIDLIRAAACAGREGLWGLPSIEGRTSFLRARWRSAHRLSSFDQAA